MNNQALAQLHRPLLDDRLFAPREQSGKSRMTASAAQKNTMTPLLAETHFGAVCGATL
jgi:hypothetical protein